MATYHQQPAPEGLLNVRNTALARLASLGMPRELIEKVDLAARQSGEAIYQFLQEETKSRP